MKLRSTMTAQHPWSRLLTQETVSRFLAAVPRGGRGVCRLWAGSRTAAGYGRFWIGFHVAAHRFMFALVHGEAAADAARVVRHTCDTPQCVNPTHLLAGTHADNMKDSLERGRHRAPGVKGVAHPAAKLTERQVRAIRQRAARGELQKTIAQRYKVSPTAICSVVSGRSWSHL